MANLAICFCCFNLTFVAFNIFTAFVPVIQYFLSPLLIAHGFIPVLLSNLLFMVAISYYHYLNFLGYDGKNNADLASLMQLL